MKKCILTTLTDSISGQNVNYIYGFDDVYGTTGNKAFFLTRSAEKEITVELIGGDSAYFSDSTYTENKGRKITIPTGTEVTNTVWVKGGSPEMILRINDYRYIFMLSVDGGINFDADYYQLMTNLEKIVIRNGIISADDFTRMQSFTVNTKLSFLQDQKNAGSILSYQKFIALDSINWAGATGSHESIIEAWLNSGRGAQDKLVTVNTPLLTINGTAANRTVYYKFTNSGVTIYATRVNTTTGSDLLATYDGNSWSYPS